MNYAVISNHSVCACAGAVRNLPGKGLFSGDFSVVPPSK